MANIQKRGDNSWTLTVYTGVQANGKYGRRTKTIRVTDEKLLKTSRKLQDYLDAEYAMFKAEVEAGEYIAPQKLTLADFVASEWAPKYAAKQLEFKTQIMLQKNLKNQILPALGHMKLEDIKPLHIISLLDQLSKDGGRADGRKGGLSSGSIRLVHRTLKNVLQRATEWRVIKTNPVDAIQKPKTERFEVQPYDEGEVTLLLQALQKAPYHWRMMTTLALTTGMRRSELLGLEWRHVDWTTGVIDVSQSMIHALKGSFIVKEPKTLKSRRKISLPASVLAELREYYAYRVKERDKVGEAWNGRDQDGREWHFMFCHPDGSPFHHERPYQWFRTFLERHELRYIRFHDLRHTAATLLINQGVHAKIISERLGHGNITTTMNIYGHALQSADQAAADKLDALFSGQQKDAQKAASERQRS
ncbi:site-specific integrase [Paenibacillus herberti]|uniref:Site-specific integrase n=1 Tax=Paenibacillus herberti TaxID=1619309 RepID=A0A229P016_9BACL|nr:site-specific integrase [Paenibacillus herberti]OXM15438.1 site-specific integrase [Paenibacillus herberti]